MLALLLAVALATLPSWIRARRALAWLRRAAVQGFPPAKLTLGLWHYQGRGMLEDREAAVACFRDAALAPSHHAPAQYALGYCFRSAGRGVGHASRDLAKSAAYFRACAKQGHAASMFSLGKLYEYFEEELIREAASPTFGRDGSGSEESVGRCDFFISHTQRNPEGKLMALDLYKTLQENGFSCWLDVKMDDMHMAAMEVGVRGSKCVLAVITGACVDNDRPEVKPEENSYFGRWMCCQELVWASEAGVPVIPVVRAEDKKKIGELIAAAPGDTEVHPRCSALKKAVGKIDFIHVDRSTKDDWNFHVSKIIKRFEESHGKKAHSRRSKGGAVPAALHTEGSKFNSAEALHWYESSEKQGHRKAQENAARFRKKLETKRRPTLANMAKEGGYAATGVAARHTDPTIIWGTLDAVC